MLNFIYFFIRIGKSAVNKYKQIFGKLPPLEEKKRQKWKFRMKMKSNPRLKARVMARRKKEKEIAKAKVRGIKDKGARALRLKIYEQKGLRYLKGSRVAGSKNDEKPTNMVFKKPVGYWRDPLKDKFVKFGKRKPSLRGLSKSQCKLMRKRQKSLKLAHRKK